MPLSEHEERVLREIAQQLSEEDPKFVATVTNTTVSRVHARRLRWAALGFAAGLVLMLGLTFHFALGAAGFALMLASVVVGANCLRALGAAPGAVLGSVRRTFRRDDR